MRILHNAALETHEFRTADVLLFGAEAAIYLTNIHYWDQFHRISDGISSQQRMQMTIERVDIEHVTSFNPERQRAIEKRLETFKVVSTQDNGDTISSALNKENYAKLMSDPEWYKEQLEEGGFYDLLGEE